MGATDLYTDCLQEAGPWLQWRTAGDRVAFGKRGRPQTRGTKLRSVFETFEKLFLYVIAIRAVSARHGEGPPYRK